jgi:hypothetical protein
LEYLTEGHVDLLLLFFAVPKGMEDVPIVYNGMGLGLNDFIWVPIFPLPTLKAMLYAVNKDTLLVGDMDIRERFLNFVLHESSQALCGMDLT